MPLEGIAELAKEELDRNPVSPSMQSTMQSFLNARLDYDKADWVYEKMAEQIKEFQDELDNEHEVGIMLASFGQPVMLAVEDIGFQNPNLIYFYGTISGNQTQLIQHMSQVNLVLTAVAKQPDKPARRIGFHVDEERQ